MFGCLDLVWFGAGLADGFLDFGFLVVVWFVLIGCLLVCMFDLHGFVDWLLVLYVGLVCCCYCFVGVSEVVVCFLGCGLGFICWI